MDKFIKLKKIGEGVFGDVSLVQRKEDGKLFALKRIDLNNQEEWTVDPLNEVNVLRNLVHPNIIKYYDAFMHGNLMCILMEYADNSDLLQKISEYKSLDQYIDEKIIINWFTQLCLAVYYLKQNKVLHRDIKLSNIFLSKDGMIKLGDFSVSQKLSNSTEFISTSIGTPYYLSPEICKGAQYNHKSDMWMLGCVLFELCSLKKPFPGDSINSIIQTILNNPPQPLPQHYSPFIYKIINQMLDKNPDKRPEAIYLLQEPEISLQLKHLLQIYKSKSITLSLDFIKQKPSFIHCPQFQQEDDIKKKSTLNSIHSLMQKTKEKLQSPLYTNKKLHAKTPSQNLFKSYYKQFTPQAISPRLQFQPTSETCKESNKKSFNFLFSNLPPSPNRTILFSDFLRQKLGDDRFKKMQKVSCQRMTVQIRIEVSRQFP